MAKSLPINSQSAQTNSDLKNALLVITMGVRVGDQVKTVGYIQELDRVHTRKNTHIKQLEPYVNGTFGGNSGDIDFNKSEYFPGETVEVAPGPLDEETVKITRTTLVTSTMFEAFMRAGGGGSLQDGAVSDVNDVTQTNRYVSLLQQVRPIDIYEMYISPIDKTVIWGLKYEDCWFRDMARTVKINEAVIIENATLDVTRTRQYFG
jgi:hypothetical protein